MPTRRITRSAVKVTGTVPDGQQFESVLEEDFFILLRFNPTVESFEQQPIALEWQDPTGSIRDYTPDVLVRYRSDVPETANLMPMLCEVKPDISDETRPSHRRKMTRSDSEKENALKWAAAERYAAQHGWGFKVYRESEIRTPYLENARFLLRHRERTMAVLELESALLSLLRDRGPLTAAKTSPLSPEETAASR